jgi:putative transposase
MSERCRMYPAPGDVAIMRDLHCAHATYVWNLCAEQESWWHPGRGHAPNWIEQCRQLTEARAEFEWLRAGSRNVQEQAIRDFHKAMAAFFAGIRGKPGYRSKRGNRGFVIEDTKVRRLNRRWGEVLVPKCGWVRFRWTRSLPEKLGMARVTLDCAGRWHISFPAPQPALDRQSTGAVVGIDRGVRTAGVTSDGQHYRVPRISDRRAARYRTLARKMSRQQKGSKRREKTRLAMARITGHVADRRRDWVEKVSTRLVMEHDLIVFEKLNTPGMVRKPKPRPDPEKEGHFLPNRRKQKTGLNKAILTTGWGYLATRTEQKAVVSNAAVLYVNPQFTSQQCRKCGHIAAENRESQAVFRCVSCGHEDHADANAAKNILARGLAELADPCASPGVRGVRPHESAAQAEAAGTIRRAA